MLYTSIFSFAHNNLKRLFLWLFKTVDRSSVVKLKNFLTLSQTTNFKLSQNERVCRCDENVEKFSIWVENAVGKGEIACYEQFLFFPHSVFKKLVRQTPKNKGLFGKGLTLSQTSPGFYVSAVQPF